MYFVILLLISFSVLSVSSSPTTFNANKIEEEGDALVNEDLDTFKSLAENKESIKSYVDKLKDYVSKGVEN